MAEATKEPAVRIPTVYRTYRRLVAIPEGEYRRLVVPYQPKKVDPVEEDAAWEAIRGIWADRDDLDAVAYQRSIRGGWGQRLIRQRRLASAGSKGTRRSKLATGSN